MGQFEIKTTEEIEKAKGYCYLDSNQYRNVEFVESERNEICLTKEEEQKQDKFLNELLEALDNGDFDIKD